MPLGGGALIDRARVYDLIDQMRVSGPGITVVHSEGFVGDDEIAALRRTETEARSQLARAEGEVSRLRRELDTRISEQGVTRIAEERSRDLLVDADQKVQHLLREAEEQAADRLAQAARVAAQQLEEADSYALQLLQRLEEQIGLFLDNIRSGIGQIEGKRPADDAPVAQYRHEPMTAAKSYAAADPEEADDAENDEYDEQGEPGDEEPQEPKAPGPQRRFPWLND